MKTKRITSKAATPPNNRYSINGATYVMLRELAQQDTDNGKRPHRNMAATLYEILAAEQKRREAQEVQG